MTSTSPHLVISVYKRKRKAQNMTPREFDWVVNAFDREAGSGQIWDRTPGQPDLWGTDEQAARDFAARLEEMN